MLPARNRKDYDDISEEARNQLEFVWLERVDDAIEAALGEASAPAEGEVPEADRRVPVTARAG